MKLEERRKLTMSHLVYCSHYHSCFICPMYEYRNKEIIFHCDQKDFENYKKLYPNWWEIHYEHIKENQQRLEEI